MFENSRNKANTMKQKADSTQHFKGLCPLGFCEKKLAKPTFANLGACCHASIWIV